MRFSVPLLATLLVLTSCCSPGRGPIPNLAVVEPGSIWRGGQPTIEGWRQLKALGVTNVVKLNTESEGSDAEAKRLGMRVVYVPIDTAQQLGLKHLPMAQMLVAVTNIIDHTYVHCEHGQDRTGLAVAMYRVRSGWSYLKATKEMFDCGFHKELRGLWEWKLSDLR